MMNIGSWTRSSPRSCASSPTPPSTTPPAPPPARRSARAARRPRLDQRHGHLPRLYARRPLRLAAEDPADQLVPLRLRLLRQPPLLQHPARPLHGRGGRHPHARVLQAQLHRRAVPLLRRHAVARLHDGAAAARRPHPAPRPRLRRLHPPQGDPRGQPLAGRAGRPLGRPALDQHRAADRGQPRPPRAGETRAVDHRRDGPDATSASPRPRPRGAASPPPARARR